MDAKRTILITDDNRINRLMLREIFKEDYNILEAENGEAALEILKREHDIISAIVLDLIMPVMDGYQVIRELKSDSQLSEIPVVIVTAMTDVENELRALDMGATDLITKPFDPRVVRQRIKMVVQKREVDSVRLENKLLKEKNQAQIQLQAILDNFIGGVALIEYGIKMKAIYSSKGFCDFIGVSDEEFFSPGFDILARVLPQYQQPLIETTHDALIRNQPYEFEYQAKRNNGKISWVHLLGVRIQYPDSPYPVVLAILTDITLQKNTEAELRQRAEFDNLTGLHNKETFFSLTHDLLNKYPDERYVIAYFDIERFKVINDLFGNEFGDRVLIDFANFLRGLTGENATCGRLQADQFAICIRNCDFDIGSIMKDIDVFINNLHMHYAVMIDVGIYNIDDRYTTVDCMCDRASLAIHTIKGNYNISYAYYDNKLRNDLISEQVMISEMKGALRDGQFCIYLQPIFSLTNCKSAEAEVLVRWNHPVKGLISPNLFIPVFEKTGFITSMDYYVWETTCKYIRSRRDRGLPDVNLSVNISRLSMYNSNICADLIELVERYRIPPSMIKLEITETAYNDNPTQLLDTMKSLQTYGFKILMDDFGSGYSSLNMLKDVPVDILKIDMEFIKGFDKSTRAGNILTSVVRMAKWLGIPVIAEGVETKVQLDFLRSIGCDKVQGYYFTRPLPVEAFEEYITKDVTILPAPLNLLSDDEDFDLLFNGNKLISKLFNSVIGGIGIYQMVDNRMEVVRVNDGYYDILGYDPQGFFNQHGDIMQTILPEDRDTLMHACLTAVREQGFTTAVIRRCSVTGQLIWLSFNIRYLGDSEDKPLICMAVNDITEQKMNEQLINEQHIELQNSFGYLDDILKTIICGIIQYTLSDTPELITLNQAACNIAGYENEFDVIGSIGTDIFGFIYPDDIEYSKDVISRAASTRQRIDMEHRIITKDGQIRWVKGAVCTVKSMDGDEILQSVFIDITPDKEKQE